MATAGVPLWSTTAATNSTADPAVNWAEGQAPSSVNDSARAMMASVAKWRDDLYGLTTGGTSTAFTVTTNATYATAAVMSGAIFTIIPNATSGASPTLAVDGLTARAINISTGVAVPTGALVSGTPYLVKYVHASTEFIVLGPLGKTLLTALDIINGTSLSAIALDDTLGLYDLSATANRRMLVSDFLKVVNLLTADGTPDRAADYVMTYDASASAAKKVLLQNLPVILPRGYIDGCLLSNGTDTTNDINFAAGVCRDSTNAVNITCAAMAGKQLDANWAPGATAGMRYSGAGIANSTYFIYAGAKADGTQDYFAIATADTASALSFWQTESGGTDYIYIRRIGAIVRAAGAIQQFTQEPNGFFRIKTPLLDVDTAVLSTTATNFTLASIPSGVSWRVLAHLSASHSSTDRHIYVRNPGDTDTAPSSTIAPLATIRTGSGGFQLHSQQQLFTDTSSQVTARSDGNSTTLKIAPLGWWDARGRDA